MAAPLALFAGDIRSIAVLRALPGLGDMLCAVPALQVLRREFPKAGITLVGLERAAWFGSRYRHLIDEFVPLPAFPSLHDGAHSLLEFPSLLAKLQQCNFDLVLQLHGSGPASNILAMLWNGKATAGYFTPGLYQPHPDLFFPYLENEPEVRRNLLLLRKLRITAPPSGLDFPFDRTDLAELDSMVGSLPETYACVHPGARQSSRRWSASGFAEVADNLARRLPVLLTGSAAEYESNQAILSMMRERARNVACDIGPGALGLLLARARLLVSNDTGVSHLGAALRLPSVVVYTAADVNRWAPADQERHRRVFVEVPCRPCAHAVCPIGHPCAEGVKPSDVIRQATYVLDTDDRRRELFVGNGKRLLLLHDGNPSSLVLTIPALRALRETLLGTQITFGTTAPQGSELVDGVVHEVLRLAATQEGLPLLNQGTIDLLQRGRYDAAILLTQTGRSPYRAAYACYLAGIPLRAGVSEEFGGGLLTHPARLPGGLHEVDRHAALLEGLGIDVKRRDIELCLPEIRGERFGHLLLTSEVVRRCRNDAHRWALLDATRAVAERSRLSVRILETPGRKDQNEWEFEAAQAEVIAPGGFRRLAETIASAAVLVTSRPLAAQLAEAFRTPMVLVDPPLTLATTERPRSAPVRFTSTQPALIAEAILALLHAGSLAETTATLRRTA